ncbi:MAG TPA: adenylate/guanylate cyclase domain-containing protein, partial [Acidimicrobiia bacterium]|nr:adenylate/guanylate cyclase domain-containing protein [Acidimicrobiia bacterium]
MELPSGTVTFLFTDLEGSTRLWEEQPERMTTALARHDAILREAIGTHHGHVVKATGDGFHAVFSRADDAVCAAIAAQRALQQETSVTDLLLVVRMGLHTGAGEERDGDYFGSAVNRAARVMAIAHGGQVLASRAVHDLVGAELDDSVELVSLGEHRLRDLAQPLEIYQVVGPGLARVFPPLESSGAQSGNLPARHNSFVGRDREVTDVAALLGETRVVTLTGVGGVGKTRLACKIAADVSPRFFHGAWLVELERVRDPAVVVDAVVAVFDLAPRPGVELIETLVTFLRSKELLLVLDNCEHLLAPVAGLVRTLEGACPGLVVLATSREGLGLAGERIVAVPSLEVPDSDECAVVASCEAVRVFVERAQAVKSDFTITEENAAAVADVVRRLDGIPLAVELAAARIPVLSPAQLAQRLDQRFRLLAGGERGAVERHATLRAAIDWSYDLLAAAEQRVLARLSVFSGGCSLEGAESVCSGGGIDEVDVLDLLAVLVARSLVVADDAPSGERRYRLLETVRQYAEERLDDDERNELHDRHSRYYADFVERATSGLRGPQQLQWQLNTNAELENLRAALAWVIAHDQGAQAERFLCAVGRVPSALSRVMLRDAEAILALPSIRSIERYPLAIAAAASAALFHGALERAEQLCQQAWDAAGEPSDQLVAFLVLTRGNIAYGRGDLPLAVDEVEQAVSRYRQVGDTFMVAFCLCGLSIWRSFTGDVTVAAAEGREALALARSTGNPGAITQALGALAVVLALTEPEQSRSFIAESLELNDALGDAVVDENALSMVLIASAVLGDREAALTLCARALRHGLSLLVAVCGCLEATADTLVVEAPEVAVVLHGAIDALLPGYDQAEPNATIRARANRTIFG